MSGTARTQQLPPHEATAGALIRHAAEHHGDRPFGVLGDRRLSYRDAEQQSADLALGPTFPERDLSALRGGTLGALSPAGAAPRANSLGMTETLGPHSIGDPAEPLRPEQEGSFGIAAPGVERRIVDPITGEEMLPGELGELWLRGYSIMLATSTSRAAWATPSRRPA